MPPNPLRPDLRVLCPVDVRMPSPAIDTSSVLRMRKFVDGEDYGYRLTLRDRWANWIAGIREKRPAVSGALAREASR